jgi:outer membrane receptor for ferric coprogen and ferric-rhodotorulic acid
VQKNEHFARAVRQAMDAFGFCPLSTFVESLCMLHPCPLPLRALAAATLACALSAHAQTATTAGPAAATSTAVRSYDLPAQPLGSALARIAADSGQQISLDAELVRGRTALAVRGSYTAEQAVRAALADSGLELVRTGAGNWSLRTQSTPAPRAAGEAPSLGEVRVSAEATRSATTEHTGSYTARAVTIGKSEQPLKDIPQSISVVTRQLMDEQNATSVYDALASTTGITLLQSPQGGKYIYSRGFDIATLQYGGVNVQRLYGRSNNYNGSTAIYDRAEILRGSAGLLQGGGDPSGAVNLSRKRPLKEGGVSVTAKAGSWDRYATQIDGSSALNAEGTLRGRAVLDVEDEHSFIDLVNHRNTTLYGTLEYDLSAQTQVSIGASYETFKGRPFISGLPRYSDGSDIRLPRSTYLGASWNRQDNSTQTIYADLSHQFNDQWRAKVSAIHVQEDVYLKYASSQRTVNPATGLGHRRQPDWRVHGVRAPARAGAGHQLQPHPGGHGLQLQDPVHPHRCVCAQSLPARTHRCRDPLRQHRKPPRHHPPAGRLWCAAPAAERPAQAGGGRPRGFLQDHLGHDRHHAGRRHTLIHPTGQQPLHAVCGPDLRSQPQLVGLRQLCRHLQPPVVTECGGPEPQAHPGCHL